MSANSPTLRPSALLVALFISGLAGAIGGCGPSGSGEAGGDAASSRMDAADGYQVDGLGTVYFPTSTGGEARSRFLRGLLYLHSFEYDDARAAFDSAQALAPEFAMAYWGEAMTHNHPLWRQQDREAGRAALRELAPTPEERRDLAATDRERAYLGALEILYGDGPKSRRDTLYERAMAGVVERFPDDVEAKAFHALSLLGLRGGERHVATFMEAGARALRLFHEHPTHPGAAHYTIHSFDDPAHAPLGLEAARAYSEIAPRAAHAQHMTSHIFLAMGLWRDVVAANEAAARTTARDRGYDGELYPCGHYAEWLAYGYLQRDRDADARDLILACHDLATGPDGSGTSGGSQGSAARMRAHYLVDVEDPDSRIVEMTLSAEGMPDRWRLALHVGDALAALGNGEVVAARAAADRLEAVAAGSGAEPGVDADARVLALSVRALAARASGDLEDALSLARQSARADEAQPVPYGPPTSYKPPRELEGEILLALDRPGEALAAFRRALERTPRRPQSLEGQVRAAEAAGRADVAERARAELKAISG